MLISKPVGKGAVAVFSECLSWLDPFLAWESWEQSRYCAAEVGQTRGFGF